jgi:hypothetical protein
MLSSILQMPTRENPLFFFALLWHAQKENPIYIYTNSDEWADLAVRTGRNKSFGHQAFHHNSSGHKGKLTGDEEEEEDQICRKAVKLCTLHQCMGISGSHGPFQSNANSILDFIHGDLTKKKSFF